MSTILIALALVAAGTPGLLLSPAELAASLKDPAIVVVAVGNSEDDFIAGHIPGARFVRYDDIAVDAGGLSSELPPIDQLRKVLSAAGISDKSKVVIYGSAITASRMFFTLDYFGHPSAKILNGGLTAWKASGGAIEVSPLPKAATATLTPKPHPERVVSADWIKERLSSTTLRQAQGRPERSRGAKMTLLDARPDVEFTGADGGMNGAHVKGRSTPHANRSIRHTGPDPNCGKVRSDARTRPRRSSATVRSVCAPVTYSWRVISATTRACMTDDCRWTQRRLPAVTATPWPNLICFKARSTC